MMWRLRGRLCPVCKERVRKGDWRARVLVECGRWVPAHWGCVSPSDAMIQRFTEDADR